MHTERFQVFFKEKIQKTINMVNNMKFYTIYPNIAHELLVTICNRISELSVKKLLIWDCIIHFIEDLCLEIDEL